MSKERARARAARESARQTERAAERERAAKKQARRKRLNALRPGLPELPRRRRRYGALPLRVVLGLAFGWVVAQWVFWQLVPDVRTRVGLALVSLLALPLVVVLLPMKGKR
ncbi:MAG: hypothetical protein JWO88_589 [Frankiales bacterium]|nr:hypothetical protein [Frankiales bacterium]